MGNVDLCIRCHETLIYHFLLDIDSTLSSINVIGETRGISDRSDRDLGSIVVINVVIIKTTHDWRAMVVVLKVVLHV